MNPLKKKQAQELQFILEKIPAIKAANNIKIRNNIIENIVIKQQKLGKIVIQKLTIKDSKALFNFYFQGLSEKSRFFFPPYPLFSPLPVSANELSRKIKEWKKEKDWTVLKLIKNRKIIGICLLKRYQTKKPTSGLAIREEFQKQGLGTILQTVINEQCRLLNLNKLFISTAQNNFASQQMHKKCGFKKTGKLIPHFTYKNGKKIIDRYDIEMVKKIKK